MENNSESLIYNAFELKGSESDKERLASIVSKVAASNLGRYVLEAVKDQGYSLELFDAWGMKGHCDPLKKRIYLNSAFMDSRLVTTLAHESRHIQQLKNGIELDNSKENIKTQIMKTRAMDADATFVEAMVAFELDKKNERIPFYQFEMENPKIAEVLKESVAKWGIEDNRVGVEVFKQWYKNDSLKTLYENFYFVGPLDKAIQDNQENLLAFNKDTPAQELVEKICVTPSGNYFSDSARILENGEYLSIKKATKVFIDDFFAVRKQKHNLDKDKSLHKIPISDDDGKMTVKPVKTNSR